MTDYRAIIRLYHQGISGRTIATTLNCSRNTVSETLKRFEQAELPWPLPAKATGKSNRDGSYCFARLCEKGLALPIHLIDK